MTRIVRSGIAVAFLCTHIFAQVPNKINWQGYLTDSNGPLDGPVDLVVSLFTSESGGAFFYQLDTTDVIADNGVVSVPLGPFSGASIDAPAYVGVAVNGGVELVPRTPLRSVPYALSVFGLRAEAADDGTFRGVNVLAGASNNTIADGVVGGTISGGGGLYGVAQVPNSVPADFGTIGGGLINAASAYAATVGGGENNSAGGEIATVGGGTGNSAAGNVSTVGGGALNTANGIYSTVSGGFGNSASGETAMVGGGSGNTASGEIATVGGGSSNTANGRYSTVGGGFRNTAGGNFSFAAGYRAKIRDHIQSGDTDGDEGTFVWSDRSQTADDDSDNFTSTGPNQFLIRAAGGVGIGTNRPQGRLHIGGASAGATSVNGFILEASEGDQTFMYFYPNQGLIFDNWRASDGRRLPILFQPNGGLVGIGTSTPNFPLEMGSGAHVTTGGVWTDASSRLWKQDFEAVETSQILEQVARLPIQRWRYKTELEAQHMGPVAEDFYAAFGLGAGDQHIAALDGNGVALAAIQGLYERLVDVEAENKGLKSRLAELESTVAALGELVTGR